MYFEENKATMEAHPATTEVSAVNVVRFPKSKLLFHQLFHLRTFFVAMPKLI